jgi:hypothetical protein
MSYYIEQYVDGRWWKIGRSFPTYEGASNKVTEYMLQGQQYGKPGHARRLPQFRIVRG